jgi:hypothetical protein
MDDAAKVAPPAEAAPDRLALIGFTVLVLIGLTAWIVLIVQVFGGWSGYQRYGPPGPKTMAAGWERFNMMQQGWALRRHV